MCPLSLSLKEEFRVLRERREKRERGTTTYRLSRSIRTHTKKKDNRSKVSTRTTKKGCKSLDSLNKRQPKKEKKRLGNPIKYLGFETLNYETTFEERSVVEREKREKRAHAHAHTHDDDDDSRELLLLLLFARDERRQIEEEEEESRERERETLSVLRVVHKKGFVSSQQLDSKRDHHRVR
jgi:hypothetical protein